MGLQDRAANDEGIGIEEPRSQANRSDVQVVVNEGVSLIFRVAVEIQQAQLVGTPVLFKGFYSQSWSSPRECRQPRIPQ